MCFASFLSGGFTTMVAINPLERKQAKRTSVQRSTMCKEEFLQGGWQNLEKQ